jgi:hypothetical protein
MKLAATFLLGATLGAQVPPPESVLGRKPGDDFYLASYDESLAYFRKLAASTDRMKLVPVGKTTRGLEWKIAIISSPKNLAAMEEHKAAARRLALVRGLSDQEARELVRRTPAIVHIDGGLHSTEVAHAQHTIQLAYNLVSAQNNPEVNAILDNVILMLWFSINPDGQNMVVEWYRSNLGTPYEVSPMPFLYQEYVGHDNNRDGYMNNMIESRVITRTLLEWNPQVVYNHHQTAPFPARIWIPPFAEPISSNVHPLMWRWVNLFGTAMAAYLDEHGMPGAMHRGRFDDWYPGFLDHVNSFRNTVSFLTETALYRYATPHFYTLDQFPARKQELRSEVFYASPWKGGWWRLGDAVRYMIGASMSVLSTSAKHRESLLYNRYQAGRDVIRRFQTEPPYAYIISRQQWDAPAAALLAEKIRFNGIEAHRARDAVSANGIEYPAGSWVILMDQPFAGLVKDLFERQKYPDTRENPNAPPDPPYDVTGWTLPLQMGVDAAAVAAPLNADWRAQLEKLDIVDPPPGSVTGAGAVYTLSRKTNNTARAINRVLAAGGTVALSRDSAVISSFDRAKLEAIVKPLGLEAVAAAKPPAGAEPLRALRIGLYRPWQPSIDEGWTRWLLEQFEFPFKNIYNADILAGHLRDRFDVIVFPDVSQRGILEGFQPGTTQGRYAGGLGDTGSAAINDFVEEGGVLITLNNSSLFALNKLNLPVRNVLDGLRSEQFFGSGTLLRIEVKDHALTAGLPKEAAAMFERGPAFETRSSFRGNVLASYPRDASPLLSGHLHGADRIQGKSAALEVIKGKGRVILIGFRPQWRGQSHGTYKFLFNALHYLPPAQTEPAAKPASSPQADAWRGVMETLRSDVQKLLELNKAYFGAKGPKAIEESKKLEAAVDQLLKERLAAIEEQRQQAEDRNAARKIGEFAAQLRKLAAQARIKEWTQTRSGDLLDAYKLETLDQEIADALAKKP